MKKESLSYSEYCIPSQAIHINYTNLIIHSKTIKLSHNLSSIRSLAYRQTVRLVIIISRNKNRQIEIEIEILGIL